MNCGRHVLFVGTTAIVAMFAAATVGGSDISPTNTDGGGPGADPSPSCFNYLQGYCCDIVGLPVKQCQHCEDQNDPDTCTEWNCHAIHEGTNDLTLIMVPAAQGWTGGTLTSGSQTFCRYFEPHCGQIVNTCYYDEEPKRFFCIEAIFQGPQNCP